MAEGLKEALLNLARAGCRSAILDGSFVSLKPLPGDYDVAYEPAGINPLRMDPVLLDFSHRRAAMKAKYGGELLIASADAGGGTPFRDFFQKDRNGMPKGVLLIDLVSLL